MRKGILVLSVCCSHLFAIAQETEQLKWLVGKWQFADSAMTITEEWGLYNDFQLKGSSKTMDKTGKVVFEESLMIESIGGDVFYIAKLPNKVGKFTMSDIGVNTVSFSDPKNDFPKNITYKRAGTILIVELEGIDKGVVVNESYTMKRVP